MNETIQTMLQHTSVRNFEDRPLPEDVKTELLQAAKSGSSSDFLQTYSIIEISDPELREKLAGITQSGPYIRQTGVFYIFVADLYRHAAALREAGQSLDALRNMEALTVAVVDTVIAAQSMTIAAESLGLGVCYIGSMRNNINLVADSLQLPDFTVPLFGLTIGYPARRNEVKPRLPLANSVSQNTYDRQAFTDLADYREQTARYYAARSSNAKQTDWVKTALEFYTAPRRQEVADFLKKQGFSLE